MKTETLSAHNGTLQKIKEEFNLADLSMIESNHNEFVFIVKDCPRVKIVIESLPDDRGMIDIFQRLIGLLQTPIAKCVEYQKLKEFRTQFKWLISDK